MKWTYIVGLSACSILAACASVGTQFSKMAEPDSGDRARVRVVANMLVKGVPNASCTDWSKAGAGTIFGGMLGSSGYRGRSLGMPNPQGVRDQNSGEFYVRANEPFAIALINTPDSRYRCSVSATFVPQKNTDYQISTRTVEKSLRKVSCEILVQEVTDTGLKPIPIQPAQCQ